MNPLHSVYWEGNAEKVRLWTDFWKMLGDLLIYRLWASVCFCLAPFASSHLHRGFLPEVNHQRVYERRIFDWYLGHVRQFLLCITTRKGAEFLLASLLIPHQWWNWGETFVFVFSVAQKDTLAMLDTFFQEISTLKTKTQLPMVIVGTQGPNDATHMNTELTSWSWRSTSFKRRGSESGREVFLWVHRSIF
jgi:hypothetical protein